MKVIVECGVNFRNMDEAYEMIRESKRIGAFLCKFQLYNDNNLKDVKDLKVRKFLKSIMLSEVDAMELHQYGHMLGQNVFFTPMFLEAVDWIVGLNCDYIKVRHRDNNDRQLYQKIKKTKIYTFISISEHNELWSNFVKYGRGAFLYCVPKYPASIVDYIFPLRNGLKYRLYNGISDHTSDLKLLKGSMNIRNFEYFEKHIKLDGTTPLEDAWSVSFSELVEVLK